tara:strand:- start:2296 stop:2646 length:351 start_codon:yes stop_codon:yes gene_type:complete
MAEPTNKKLYAKAKAKYSSMKHSAYKSSLVVKEYKKMGGKYSGAKPTKTGLTRWHKEDWRTQDGKKTYNGKKGKIFRPTKRITKDTPTTMKELTPAQKKKAIAEKKKKGRVTKYKK